MTLTCVWDDIIRKNIVYMSTTGSADQCGDSAEFESMRLYFQNFKLFDWMVIVTAVMPPVIHIGLSSPISLQLLLIKY
jgi:hypothetical protein